MIKSTLYKTFITALFILLPFLCLSAEAAMGDLVANWWIYDPSFSSTYNPFIDPTGVALDGNGNVYVAGMNDNGTRSWPGRVNVYSNAGLWLTGWGTNGSGDGQFSEPRGIAVDGSGNVYVADSWNQRVQVFNRDGTFLRKWGTYGSGDGQFKYPCGVAVDGSGRVYVTDLLNRRIQVFGSDGTFLGKWGTFGSGDGQFVSPAYIAVDRSGNVYVYDGYGQNIVSPWNFVYNCRVQVFSNTGAFLRKWGSVGFTDGLFYQDGGLAVDGNGIVYVPSINWMVVQVFSNEGTFLGKWGRTDELIGLAADGNGNIYGAGIHSNQIWVYKGYQSCVLTANAGTDQTIEQTSSAGAYVSLNGSGTAQGCTGDLTYAWTWSGGSATGANPTVLMPPGTTSVTLTVTSGTQTATAAVAVTVRDTLAPVTTASISGIAGNNGWHVSDAVISLNASDSGSGVKEIHYSINGGAETVLPGNSASPGITADGANTITYYAKDNAGNEETPHHTAIIMIDKTAPTVSASVSPAANANGWNNTDVTVTFTCNDATSGIATCPAPVTVSAEGVNQVVTGAAVDKAGNTATTSVTLNIDKTAPTIAAAASPSPNANGWNNTDVTITFTCSDALSGTVSCPAPITVTTEGAGQAISGSVVDKAGNTATATVTVNIDKKAPVVAIAADPSVLWPPNHKMVNVKITGSATDSGSGVSSVVFTVTDEYGAVQPTISGFDTTIQLRASRKGSDKDGRLYTITAVATDKAGNQSTASTTVVVPHDKGDRDEKDEDSHGDDGKQDD